MMDAIRPTAADIERVARAHQAATLDILRAMSASPGDPQPVFDLIVRHAQTLCSSTNASLFEYDGTLAHCRGMASSVSSQEEIDAYTRQYPMPMAGGSQHGPLEVIAAGEIIHVRDAEAEGKLSPAARGLGIRSAIGIPMVRDGVTIGCIAMSNHAVGGFSDSQIALLQTFAEQAVIAIASAEAHREQRESLQQQTAMAEVLHVINASPGDLIPVFDTVLEKAMLLCDTAFGSFATYDGTRFLNVTWRGVSPELVELFHQPMHVVPGMLFHRLEHGEEVVQATDIKDDEIYRSGHPERRTLVDIGGARSQLVVALRKDGNLLGALNLFRQEVRPFTDKQIALLKNFAAQAVIAMDNARLLTEQREALERQTATAEVLGVINANPGNLTPVFDAMLERALQLCDSAFGGLYTFDGEVFHVQATHGMPPDVARITAIRPGPGMTLHQLVQGADTVQTMDLAQLPAAPSRKALVEIGGARTQLQIAMRKEGVLLGTLMFYRREVRPFSERQIALLKNFAAQAVIAMENARLLDELRQRTDELAQRNREFSERIDHQAATIDVLKAMSASPGDPQPVFDLIARRTAEVCRVPNAVLFRYEDGLLHWRASSGTEVYASDAALEALRAEFPMPPRPTSLVGRTVLERRMIHTPNVEAEKDLYPALRGIDMKSFLSVPLLRDGEPLGAIGLSSKEPGGYSPSQIELLQAFAEQAVIAITSAETYLALQGRTRDLEEALERQTATADVLQVINASPGELKPVFDAMLEKAMRLCDAAFGILATYDGKSFVSTAWRGLPPAFEEFVSRPIPLDGEHTESALSRVVSGIDVIHEPDITDDEVYRSGIGSRRELADLGGARTRLMVALRRDNVLLGVINVYRTEVRPFSDKQIALLQDFAAQAVIAMENARLLDEIRQRQNELRVTFENMGDGVAMFDETQNLVAWNRKFQDILEVPDDIIAQRRSLPDYIRYLAERGEFGSDADVEEQVRRVLATTSQTRVFERERPNGRVLEIHSNPVPGGGFVLIYSDITERKRNEAEIAAARDAAQEATRMIEAAFQELKIAQANLIQAEKMASLGQLTAGIAHEIKNPLNFVNNFASLSVDLLAELKEAAAPGFAALTGEQRAEIDDVSAMLTSNLQKIAEHGKRADGIVKSMLEHSRGDSGEWRKVDINVLADEALNLAYHGARAQDQSFNITLERDFGDEIAPIELNPQDITRVLLNLFGNGFYAANRRARDGAAPGFSPTLKLTTRDLGRAVEIRVRDNGAGIPEDIRDKLFQPFFTTKPTGEGTGLGLSITYDIVTKQHGGTIAVDSEVNAFTEFVVTLPRGSHA